MTAKQRDLNVPGTPQKSAPDASDLQDNARQIAYAHRVSRRTGKRALLDHLAEQSLVLYEAHQYYMRRSDADLAVSLAGRWMLDNFYVIQHSLRQVREDMPKGYYLELPILDGGSLAGYPRIYALSCEAICRSRGRSDIEQIERFVQAYQSVTPLTMGELWALPTMLRLVTFENLTAALLEIAELGQVYKRESLFASEPLLQGLPAEEVVANAVPSLHVFLNLDWKSIFERLSLVERALRDDPCGAYARMDFDTRDRYRKAVEAIARNSVHSEREIAQRAVHLAEANAVESLKLDSPDLLDTDPAALRRSHVGYYLLDDGRAELEACLDYHPTWLIRLRRRASRHISLLYLGGIALFTGALLSVVVGVGSLAGGTFSQLVAIGLLALIPAGTVAIDVLNWLVMRIVPSRTLPKLDLSERIPAEYRTMIVVPALLSSQAEVDNLLHQLELHFLSNADLNLYFALLTDLVDAPQAQMPDDAALVERAREGIQRLNQEHRRNSSDPFYLFHRERKWNPGEAQWMGWERKRGKLSEFNRLLAGKTGTSYAVTVGDMDVLPGIKYVITLDADTLLPHGSAHHLVGTMAHPLNRPQFDGKSSHVVAGYTILQPRTEIKPTSANQSFFARVFSGDRGVDLYSRAVSNVYQDLFGEGIYVGKGIYDVAAFERSLAGCTPENSLLSHDLFEGVHGRAGLVTDVTLYEDYPLHYPAYTHRLHRWIRGDWQLLPWLLPSVPHEVGKRVRNRLSVLDRWKILDNLRRSLIAPAQLALFVVGWLWLPGSPLVWTLVSALTTAVSVLTGLWAVVAGGVQNGALSRQGLTNLWYDLLRWLLGLVFVPYQAIVALDAIASTLVRLGITRRHLLQWTTAAHTLRLFGRNLRVGVTWMRMWSASILALVVGGLVGLLAPRAFLTAAPLLLVWLLSPQIAYWISKLSPAKAFDLQDEDRRRMRHLARRTWLYYERFVGPDDHWLPPDHFQEDPLGAVAHRTSPTNIGLLFLSTLGAYDLGYIGVLELAVRLRDTFEGLEGLERYRGHLYNWYDTRSREPLKPRYVSTVDSGNLAGCLIALGQACTDLLQNSVVRQQAAQGLADTCALMDNSIHQLGDGELGREAASLYDALALIQKRLEDARDDPQVWGALLIELQETSWQEIDEQVMDFITSRTNEPDPAALDDLRTWNERVSYHLSSMRHELDALLPWWTLLAHPPALLAQPGSDDYLERAWQELIDSLSGLPSLAGMAEFCAVAGSHLERLRLLLEQVASGGADNDCVADALAWCQDLDSKLQHARLVASGLVTAYHDLGVKANNRVDEMDFSFLFDSQRQVFRIGYNMMAEKPDNAYYDLLASEARIASLVAIAKGDVPQSHWLHMARPLAQVDGMRSLLSWSGTMFEYLMPTLLVESYTDTLLDQSCRAVIERQIAYAQGHGVPWGVSESAFYQFDAGREYQYRAFGVPGLGLKRGLGEDLVIAPYASLLALPFRAQAVLHNLTRFEAMGALGHYGLFDAIDYTRSRLPLGKSYALVRSYMAHHQGMVMLSLVNALADKVMVQRFHRDPRIKSIELFLHEQMPQRAPLEDLAEKEHSPTRRAEPLVSLKSWPAMVGTLLPQTHILSNGSFSTFITAAGGGYSQCTLPREKGSDEQDVLALTRWRADTTLDEWGNWIYVQDKDSGDLWSATCQPTAVLSEQQEVWFDPYKAEFRRRDHAISLRMEVTVPPVDNLEIRRIALTNHSSETRRLAITSYGEVILTTQAFDRQHPAFNKLFIESEYLADLGTLLFIRRPRSGTEAPIYLAHMITAQDSPPAAVGYETDRCLFIGRGRTARAPRSLCEDDISLPGTTGATLDPVMALQCEIQIAPYATTEIAYVTLAAPSREEALALARRYRRWHVIRRAFDLACSQSILALDDLGLDVKAVEQINRLFSALMYPYAGLRSEPETLVQNCKGQPGLWAYGISGDYPILLVRVGQEDEMDLVVRVLEAHAYWRARRIQADLVLLNERETGYSQDLQGQLNRLIARRGADAWLNQRGGIFVLRADQMAEADRVLLFTAARVVLDCADGPLADQAARLEENPVWLPDFVPIFPDAGEIAPTPLLERPGDLLFDNGYGGFSPDGREYVIDLSPGEWTPAPWINVIANPDFGFLTSEAGLGCTWSGNSGENRLTPWRNDPVSDGPAEALYLRDEETGQVWTPTPLPMRVRAPYLIRHGAGYTLFEHHSHGLKQRVRVFAVHNAPVKIVQLRMENAWQRNRRITATLYAEWVLGTTRGVTQQYIIPEFDTEMQTLLASNPYNVEFAERVAFASASQQLHGLTADRTEFLGTLGDMGHPAALYRIGLAGTVEAGRDPCAAVQVHIELGAGETQQVHFLLGQGANREDALRLVRMYQEPKAVEAAWEATNQFWDKTLDAVTVNTPDTAMDVLLNRWLLYQTIACRLWGRSALYQSSGAYGFRDQLQDIMAVIHARPELARAHILRSARHQFEAGDVLHWWHPPSGRGVRTRISDDLLWLPYVTTHYVESTGDESILAETLPFLAADPLQPEEAERYGHYRQTKRDSTLYEHCRRALDKGTTSGKHDLPLIGSGDWNDGMNRVGIAGRGESVWLGWFLYDCLSRFARLCERQGDTETAGRYRRRAGELQTALQKNAWDGEWYRRAYYDDGTPVGSAQNQECQIDSIAQSWSVLSGATDGNRAGAAMDAVYRQLVRPQEQLVLLFTPPFDKTPRDPGYIKGYPPGIRENGGQYTHAALWTAWAFARLGQGTRAQTLFDLMNPIYHSDMLKKAQRYRVEPYVVAADVYSVSPHTGRGGWTWYTGSSGWMYRLGIEGILGLRRMGAALEIDPRISSAWERFEVAYRFGKACYRIQVENPDAVEQGVRKIVLDGRTLPDHTIPLNDDGHEHAVYVEMG